METVGNPIPSGWFEAIKKNNNLSGWSFQPIPQKKYRSIWIIPKIGINIIPICLKSPNVFLHGQSLIVHNKSKKIVSIQAWGCSHCFLVKKEFPHFTISWPEEYHHLRKNKNCQASPEVGNCPILGILDITL